jgi:hypothetical protein
VIRLVAGRWINPEEVIAVNGGGAKVTARMTDERFLDFTIGDTLDGVVDQINAACLEVEIARAQAWDGGPAMPLTRRPGYVRAQHPSEYPG